MAGLFDSTIASLPALGMGMYNQYLAREATAPGRAEVRANESPGESIAYDPQSYDYISVDPSRYDPEISQGIADFGGHFRDDSYGIDTQDMYGDWRRAMMAGHLDRLQTEQEIEQDQLTQTNLYEEALGQGEQNYEETLAEMDQMFGQGMGDLFSQQMLGEMHLQQGQQRAQQNLQELRGDLSDQIGGFSERLAQNLENSLSLRSDALTAHADQSARILEDSTTAINTRLGVEMAEIDGNPNIPAGAKEGMKQRLSVHRGQEIHRQANHVRAQEAIRHDTLMTAHNKLINNTMTQGATAMAQLKGFTGQALAQGYGDVQRANQQLEIAGAKMAEGFAEMGNNYRAAHTAAKASTRASMTGYVTQGRMDLFNMEGSRARAIVDYSGLFNSLISSEIGMNNAEFARDMAQLQADMNVFGLTLEAMMPFQQQAVQTFSNSMLQQEPQESGGFMGSTTAGTLASGYGGYLAAGKAAGGAISFGIGALACIDCNAQILMAGGGVKRLRDIALGDRVKTSSGDLSKVIAKDLGILHPQFSNKFVRLQGDKGRSLVMTSDHKVMWADQKVRAENWTKISGKKLKKARPLPVGDLLLENGEAYIANGFHVVSSITKKMVQQIPALGSLESTNQMVERLNRVEGKMITQIAKLELQLEGAA